MLHNTPDNSVAEAHARWRANYERNVEAMRRLMAASPVDEIPTPSAD